MNCTIADNVEVNAIGGALTAWQQSHPVARNTIFSGNGSREISLVDGSSLSVSYCDIQGGPSQVMAMSDCTLTWGAGNLDDDPRFLARGQWDPNGTPEDALDDLWLDDDYQLRGDSPCVDAGDPGLVVDPDETDLNGQPRLVGARIDMGAYEYEPPPWVRHDWNGDGIVSIVGDVPPFVNCVYFQDCPGDMDKVAIGDCNNDGLISIIGDVPCFVGCVYFEACP